MSLRYRRRGALAAGRRLAGVADQDPACENGTVGCPGSGSGPLPCFDCLAQGGGA